MALLRVLLFIGAILMAAAVIWLAVQVFTGDKDLDPDFPPSITDREDPKGDGNFTDNSGDQQQNGSQDPSSGSAAIPAGTAPSEPSRGTPSTPNPSSPSQPQPEPSQPTPPIIPILPINPPPLLDPILDPLKPVTDPILKDGLLGPVLQ